MQVLEIPLRFDCYKCSDRFGQNEFKCSVWWCNPNPSCQDLVSISAGCLLFLYAGSVHHLTLMVLIAWKVCCGKKPTCKSCILDETHSRWAWALQSGLTLIKYQLALLLYLISCHIHTFTGLVEKKKSLNEICGLAASYNLQHRSMQVLWSHTFLCPFNMEKYNRRLNGNLSTDVLWQYLR